MKNCIMQEEAIKTYRNKLIQSNEDPWTKKDSSSECILFCKKVTPNIFNIKNGFAVIAGSEKCFSDGICMISNFTKIIFVFDETKWGRRLSN
jgi:NAD-dependent dihydropyrimidine dehydrogenase PreA subunit